MLKHHLIEQDEEILELASSQVIETSRVIEDYPEQCWTWTEWAWQEHLSRKIRPEGTARFAGR